MPPFPQEEDTEVLIFVTSSRTDGVELREDGGVELREDGTTEIREAN